MPSTDSHIDFSALRAECSRTVRDIVVDAAGDLARTDRLWALLARHLPGLTGVRLETDRGEVLAAFPEPRSAGVSFREEDKSGTRFPIPGHPVSLAVTRSGPFSPIERRVCEEVAATIGTVLELREALARRARMLEEDFGRLVDATREITLCRTMDDLYAVIAREGQRLLKEKQHNILSLQQYSPSSEELTLVALSGEGTEARVGLKLTTRLETTRTRYYPRYEDGRIATGLPPQTALSFTGALLKGGNPFLLITDVSQLDDGAPYYCLSPRTRSEIAVPIVLADGRRWGVLNAENPRPNAFSEFFDLPILQSYARIIAVFIQDFERRSRVRTVDDLVALPRDLKRAIRLFSQSSETVLITGETGTGKELVARALHYGGPRRRHPFVPVNSGAIEPNLMMSELFGHVGGAFSGASPRDKSGLFQAADKGTVFLDEIENMSLPVQEAVLRVLDRGEVRKVGGTVVEQVDVRIIAATNVDLRQRIREGTFREDLYYRLQILEVHIPPLRERPEHIRELFEMFVGQFRRPMQEVHIDEALFEVLERYPWPGNVRELRNLVKRMLVFSSDLTVDLLPEPIRRAAASARGSGPVERAPGGMGPGPRDGEADVRDPRAGIRVTFEFPENAEGVKRQVERRLLEVALARFQGNRYRTARFLGMSPPSVYRKIREYGIEEERRYR